MLALILIAIAVIIIIGLGTWFLARRAKKQKQEAEFQKGFQPFLNEILALPVGPELTFSANYSYTGLLVRNPQFGKMKVDIKVKVGKVKYAARLYYTARLNGEVPARSFSSQADLVLYVHSHIRDVYSTYEIFGVS